MLETIFGIILYSIICAFFYVPKSYAVQLAAIDELWEAIEDDLDTEEEESNDIEAEDFGTEEEDDTFYTGLSIRALKSLASSYRIPYYGSLNKANLIQAISNITKL